MKILFYCDEYPPAQHGGIGSVVKIIAESLANKGHQVYVLGSYEYGHGLKDYSILNGVHIYRLTHFSYIKFIPRFAFNIINRILRDLNFLNLAAQKSIRITEFFMEKLIISANIEILELVDYQEIFRYLRSEVNFTKFTIPTIIRVHGSHSFLAKHKGKMNDIWLRNDINNFDRCDRVSAVSKFSAKYVIENLKIENKKIDVIYNPVEKSLLAGRPQISKKNKVLFIGKIVETKGAFSLLKAFNIIAVSNPELELILIGGGNISHGKELITPHFQDRVCFTGYLKRNEILKYIDESLFCVVPSYFENFGMVPLEIMARGKALIYTSRASGPEVITHLVDGLLVEPTDIESLVSNIKLLLNNKELRDKLGVEAYKKIQNNFITDRIVLELEEYYSSIIKKTYS